MKYIETQASYETARQMLDEQRAYLEKHYMLPNGWIVVDKVDDKIPHRDIVDNDLRSAVEEYKWRNYPPNKAFVYVNERDFTITTWTGQLLGKITDFRTSYRSSFGDIRSPISVLGTNGIGYYGTAYTSAGDYARITAYKGQL